MLNRISTYPPIVRWVGMAVVTIGLTMVAELEIDIGGCGKQAVECSSCHGPNKWGGSF